MRAHFDLDPKIIYLNSGTHSITPRYVRNAVIQYLTDYERDPTLQLMRIWPRIWRVQERLADFFQADPRDLFLVPNVSYAMNQFILGAPLKAGQEILLSNLEYGAVQRICRFRSERDRLPLRIFHLPKDAAELNRLEADGIVDKILSQLKPETGILVISHVYMSNGLKIPLEKLSKATRARGVQLVVDGAHAPGGIALDFRTLQDVDYYTGNLHKWMMGPKGTAFAWVAKLRQNELVPLTAGWTTYDPPPLYAAFSEAGAFALRFLNSACLDFWQMLGEEKIRARIYELQSYAEAQLSARLGWQTISPKAELRGPLLSYPLPERWQELGQKNIFRLEREHHLVVGFPYHDGRWVLRLSPHIYNEESEIDRAIEILKISMA